ncbi:hypothetical protein L218DRAFT_1077694 [Marasmius fiardii PR-910]|nr:hypothetical protein L218DRAFT_1077694 [Marasmius fiardii PR-910]
MVKRQGVVWFFLWPDSPFAQRPINRQYIRRRPYDPEASIDEEMKAAARKLEVNYHFTLYRPKEILLVSPTPTLQERVMASLMDGGLKELDIGHLQRKVWETEVSDQEDEDLNIDVVAVNNQVLEEIKPIQSLPKELHGRRRDLKARNEALRKHVVTPSSAAEDAYKSSSWDLLMAGRPLDN